MNNEEKINKAIEPLVKMYEEIENDLLIKIAQNFKINEEFLNSDYWRIKKMEEMGLFNEEVIKYISKYTKKTNRAIKKALEDIGYDALNISKLKGAFKDGKIKVKPDILLQNGVIQSIIDNSYDEITNRFINMSQKIEDSARNAYLDIVEKGYLKTSMGTHSYQEAIRESLNELGNKGITTLTYTTRSENDEIIGVRTYDIESATRREILNGARKVSEDINKTVVEELKCEYVYLSEHLRCRPQHFDWQGTIIKYSDLIKVTGYGEVDGLCGINCAHYFEPYFGSARGNDLKFISKEEATKQYKISQQQRYLERGVRKWKRKSNMFDANGDKDAYYKCQLKTLEWQERLQDFTKQNKTRRDFTREYVSGFNSDTIFDTIGSLNNVNIAPSKTLLKMDKELLVNNIKQIKLLSKKYELEDFLQSMNATYRCEKRDSIASVGYNFSASNITIISSKEFFEDKEYLREVMDENIKSNWSMKCPTDKYTIYPMTHEMGHVLEMKLFKDKYPLGRKSEYLDFCKNTKNDIIKLAQSKNKLFNYQTVISEYGLKNDRDFFAEIFAGMELGEKNELSEALKEYLKGKIK